VRWELDDVHWLGGAYETCFFFGSEIPFDDGRGNEAKVEAVGAWVGEIKVED
jgi:hypothetical protein